MKTKQVKFGASCMFIGFDRHYGVKFYDTKQERDISFFQQKRASKLGLGPKVFKRFSLRKGISAYDHRWKITKCNKYGFIIARAVTTRKRAPGDISRLKRQMEKAGFPTYDMHGNNVGYIGNKLVCIDFDAGSMG